MKNPKLQKENKKVLVTGGAGYIGSVLVRLLLDEGYYVRVMDNLMFGGESIIDLLNNENFDFVFGDIRIHEDQVKALEGIDHIVNLAAIVGDPACAQQPDLAKETNYEAVKSFYKLAEEKGIGKFIMASTCSNYGKMENSNEYVNEESELNPISIYSETKVEAEKFLLNQANTNLCKPTCLRFSTVYGLSPRIRFDLTVNEFSCELALGRELVVFGEQFWRPYAHVVDLARSVISVLDASAEKTAFEVFNVGDTNENYQKQMIVDEMIKIIPDAKVKYVSKDEDPRDYRVNFDKIKDTLDFKITKKVSDGIKQIYKVINEGLILNPDDKKYKNS